MGGGEEEGHGYRRIDRTVSFTVSTGEHLVGEVEVYIGADFKNTDELT